MKHEQEIRRVIELQKQIVAMQTEVSETIEAIIAPPHSGTGTKYVIDGELWEVNRWPLEGAPTREYFKAWCLKNRGKIAE